MNELKNIPSVDVLLKEENIHKLIEQFGRDLTLKALRLALSYFREDVRSGSNVPDAVEITTLTKATLKGWLRPSLLPVINASGIILHTNLGRTPLSKETISAMQAVSNSYSNLEYDLDKGKRGKRSIHAESLIQTLTGAESALVVNNNAAAVLLVLTALARGKKVIIANSQLVEIGGGFRIPDVMRQSGAKLSAVGTTNRVHISDYEKALEEPVALVLTAHHSNFKIIGFATEPPLPEISEVAHRAGITLVNDLGSGAMLDTSQFCSAHEPTIQEALEAGADIVCFSGDKLLGGPQAGIIIGKRELLEKIKKHPLARAVRADKLCLAGISATLTHYLKGEALEKIPVWQMIALDVKEIHRRAENWREMLGEGNVVEGKSMVGGGSLPGESLNTYLLTLKVEKPNQFLKTLRQQSVPIIARIEKDRIAVDPRTVFVEQEEELIVGLKKAISIEQKSSTGE